MFSEKDKFSWIASIPTWIVNSTESQRHLARPTYVQARSALVLKIVEIGIDSAADFFVVIAAAGRKL